MELLSRNVRDNQQMLTMAWSVKEAIFKWFGEGEMDFIRHMEIVKVGKSSGGYITSCKMKKNTPVNLEIRSIDQGYNVLSWLIT